VKKRENVRKRLKNEKTWKKENVKKGERERKKKNERRRPRKKEYVAHCDRQQQQRRTRRPAGK
jgi:hypothetical protein